MEDFMTALTIFTHSTQNSYTSNRHLHPPRN